MARNTYFENEVIVKEFDAHAVKRLLSYVGRHKKRVLVTTFLMIVASLLGLAPPYLLKVAIDDFIPAANIAFLVYTGIAIVVMQALNGLFLAMRVRIMNRIGQDVIHEIRSDVFSKLQELGFYFYDSRPHGKILIRVVNYVNSLANLLSNGIVNLITDVFSLAFIIGFMLLINVRLTLVCLAGLPILVLFVFSLKKKQHQSWQKMSQTQASLNAYLHETIIGVRVTQSFAQEERTERTFEGLSDAWKSSWLAAVGRMFMVGPGIELVSILGVCAVYVLGISWVDNGITIGVLIAFVGYINRFWTPIASIGTFYGNLVTSAAYLERIFEMMDEKAEDPEDHDRPDMPLIKGHVSFDRVTFAYDEGCQPVFDDFTLSIAAGETVAVVGPTGAGKTTLVNLVSRFYRANGGRVLIDGHDVKDFNHKSIRSQIGVMMQDTFLFSGSVRDNIRYGRLDATDGDVEMAARNVHAHGFIMSLDKGYDTMLNERGSRLSMGQRQLISFARALLADPAILILDEATSSVDTETERLIQKGILNLVSNRTSFVIAHRLSTIVGADRILYMDSGRIVESGTHDELVAMKGRYWSQYAKSSSAGREAVPTPR